MDDTLTHALGSSIAGCLAERVLQTFPDKRLNIGHTVQAEAMARDLGARRVDIPTHRIYRFPDASLLMVKAGRKLRASPPKQPESQ